MTVFDLLKLFGGLALFLFGMSTMAVGLEKVAGSKLEGILSKLTKNPISAVLFGALLTAAIQSSSATTVMVVGLVNSGIMQLSQAIGVIMGANIGTTITAQVLRLSDINSDNFWLQLLKPTTLAPVFSCVGAFFYLFSKKARRRNWGQVLIGFGILFTGMFTMEAAVYPLRSSVLFEELFSTLRNPIFGVLVGAGVTAIIQSSSASVGILQALSSTGIITWATAVPIILGQNIGTCITPMLASIGATKAAKRSAFSHLYFNIIGTAVFIAAIYGIKYTIGISFWEASIGRGGIANFHTLFNLIVTLMFLPFTKALAKLAELSVPGKKGEVDTLDCVVLDERLLAAPTVAIQQAHGAVETMAMMAKNNLSLVIPLFTQFDSTVIKNITDNENIIDKLEVSVSNYLIKITHKELVDDESNTVSALLNMVSDFERIGDHVVNISEWVQQLNDKGIVFSDKANRELSLLFDAVNENIILATAAFSSTNSKKAVLVEPLEDTIDRMCEKLRFKHIERLKKGKCSLEAGLVFIGVISDAERISDHCSNIANRVIYLESSDEHYDQHEIKNRMHSDTLSDAETAALLDYKQRYLAQI